MPAIRQGVFMEEDEIKDAVKGAEESFRLPKLLATEYFQKYREDLFRKYKEGSQLGYRNYFYLLKYLNEIAEYDEAHAGSFQKKFLGSSSSNDWRNFEAVFAEVIVYRNYIRDVYEGLLHRIHLEASEADIILERPDGTKAFLEVFCVMPELKMPTHPEEVVVENINTQTQSAMASIRQKLLRKIMKQKQMTSVRENFAVIEINSYLFSGDFFILSSLSDGYKITIDRATMKTVRKGYDWKSSVFDDPSTSFLKGVIYFDLGDYQSRKYIFNPKYSGPNG
jgi:hypothetical protein